jgi:hypothetical protein
LANVAPAWPLAARAQQAERMRPTQGFSESRPTFSEISSVVMPTSISLEEHLQELQWEQRKASNHNSENHAVADGATEDRVERTVDLGRGTPLAGSA